MLELNKIHLGDCLELMKEIPDKGVDLVLTDPPYNASNSNLGFKTKNYRTINEKWDKDFNLEFIELIEKITKGSFLVFCSYHLLNDYLNKVTFKLQQIIHWAKTNPFPAIAKVYTPNIEYILWFIASNPYIFNKDYAEQNLIYTNILNSKENNGHPAQKPLELIKKLIMIHSNEGDTVLDCFSGSGTTAIACLELNRNFICIEKDPKYYELSVKRVEDYKAQLKMEFV